MAQKQQMKITILPSGEVKIEVICGPGTECAKVSAALEQSLGTVTNVERKAEYYQTAETEAAKVGVKG
jgi:hypothetical protein